MTSRRSPRRPIVAALTTLMAVACGAADPTRWAAPRNPALAVAIASTVEVEPEPGVYEIVPLVDSLYAGDSVQLALTGPAVTELTVVTWSSSDDSVLVVDRTTGMAHGVRPGTVTVEGSALLRGRPRVSATIAVIEPPVALPPPEPAPEPVSPAVPAPPAAAPELPRSYVSTAVPAPTGRTIAVPAGGNLQAALDAAQPGDVVALAAGATFVGNFTLRAKSGAGWVTVRTAASDGALPPAGTRVTPAHAAALPKILTPNSAPALKTADGARRWRLLGLEISAVPTLTMNYTLVALGEGSTALQTAASQLPGELVLERVYVHGHAKLHVRRCIGLNSASTAIVDSYVDECHSNQGDSQAIMGWNGPGPFKIVNNYLAAGHEVIDFGGPTPGIAGLIPSDIEVRRNHLTRPLAWKGVWTVKNLFECKSCQRVLLEENVLENNWLGAQPGFAIVLQGLTDGNDAPQNRIWDVTIRRNVIRNTAAGINLLSRVAYNGVSRPALLPDEPMRRVAVTDNLIVVGGGPGGVFDGNMRMFQILQDARDVTIARNTVVGALGAKAQSQLVFDGVTPTERLTVVANVFGPATYGVMGNGVNGIPKTLAKFAPDAVLRDNVFTALPASARIPGNWYPATPAAVGLAGLLAGNYRVVGRPAEIPDSVGVDIEMLEQATAGVVLP
jgi:hypothetical protein